MKTIEEHINSINTKLQLLLKKYAALQKENAMLTHEVEVCKKNEKIGSIISFLLPGDCGISTNQVTKAYQ